MDEENSESFQQSQSNEEVRQSRNRKRPKVDDTLEDSDYDSHKSNKNKSKKTKSISKVGSKKVKQKGTIDSFFTSASNFNAPDNTAGTPQTNTELIISAQQVTEMSSTPQSYDSTNTDENSSKKRKLEVESASSQNHTENQTSPSKKESINSEISDKKSPQKKKPKLRQETSKKASTAIERQHSDSKNNVMNASGGGSSQTSIYSFFQSRLNSGVQNETSREQTVVNIDNDEDKCAEKNQQTVVQRQFENDVNEARSPIEVEVVSDHTTKQTTPKKKGNRKVNQFVRFDTIVFLNFLWSISRLNFSEQSRKKKNPTTKNARR